MAKLRTFQSIVDDVYVLQFTNEAADISKADLDLIAKFGEPEVNFGGSGTSDAAPVFSGTAVSSATFTFALPDVWVKLVSGMPYKLAVDPTSPPWAQVITTTPPAITLGDLLTTYRTTIQTRVAAAFATLRAKTDNFTNEYLSVI